MYIAFTYERTHPNPLAYLPSGHSRPPELMQSKRAILISIAATVGGVLILTLLAVCKFSI